MHGLPVGDFRSQVNLKIPQIDIDQWKTCGHNVVLPAQKKMHKFHTVTKV